MLFQYAFLPAFHPTRGIGFKILNFQPHNPLNEIYKIAKLKHNQTKLNKRDKTIQT